MRKLNRYTCSTLICLDQLIYKIKSKNVYWHGDTLVIENGKGVISECRTHFPSSWFILACKIQNRWPWTRHLLSL